MQYIQLTNDHIILQTSGGPRSVTRESFNYVTIQRKLLKGCTEEDILPLLDIPELPNGRYKVYIDSSTNELVYKHYTNDYTTTCLNLKGEKSSYIKPTATFVGMYASIEDILEDWPEYVL